MSVENTEYDPNETIWGAVDELELKGYTKREIHDHLRMVAENMRGRTGFHRGNGGDEN